MAMASAGQSVEHRPQPPHSAASTTRLVGGAQRDGVERASFDAVRALRALLAVDDGKVAAPRRDALGVQPRRRQMRKAGKRSAPRPQESGEQGDGIASNLGAEDASKAEEERAPLQAAGHRSRQ